MSTLKLVVAVAVVVVAGCASVDDLLDRDKTVELSEVPAAARNAAAKAVEGIVLTEAEVEEEDGQLVYEIEGEADGKEYEIEVTAEGKVLEIEEEDEDEK